MRDTFWDQPNLVLLLGGTDVRVQRTVRGVDVELLGGQREGRRQGRVVVRTNWNWQVVEPAGRVEFIVGGDASDDPDAVLARFGAWVDAGRPPLNGGGVEYEHLTH